MKKNLKLEKIIKLLLIILIIVLIVVIFFTIDYSRALKGKRPIFCIKNPAGVVEDGGTIEYYGLGYKIIDFNRLDGYDKTKVGLWSMKYEDFKEEYEGQDENMKYTISAVIMKVNDKTLEVVNIENNDIPLLSEPTMIEDADFLVMESTYGDRHHMRNDNKAELFVDIVSETIRSGKYRK